MPSGVRAAGEAMFARYAYPPNALGYCGSGDGRELLEFADGHLDPAVPTGAVVQAAQDLDKTLGADMALGADMEQRAKAFDGAWPYLEHLAASSGAGSVMDQRVVEAYWVGNELLNSGDVESFAAAVRTAFAGQSGTDLEALDASPAPVAHHSFHVFAVYPWVGILRRTGAPHALRVLDRCRIRWGQVLDVGGAQVQVRYQPLCWDGSRLGLGEPTTESARLSADGRSLTAVQPGDWVALHWDWVCDRLTAIQLSALRRYTARQLAITNRTRADRSAAEQPAC